MVLSREKISLSFQVASNRPPTIWRSERQHPVTETRAASVSAPLLDGNELRPVLHLHARHEPILAVLGLENRCFAFLHIEPVLAQGIDDVGLCLSCGDRYFAPLISLSNARAALLK